jgi:hypothetical protein
MSLVSCDRFRASSGPSRILDPPAVKDVPVSGMGTSLIVEPASLSSTIVSPLHQKVKPLLIE